MSEILNWQGTEVSLPDTQDISIIARCSKQLSAKDIEQIVFALDKGYFDMGLGYLWDKTITALKKELAFVGIELLGEMVGKNGVEHDDDVNDVLTTPEALRLANELGIVTDAGGMRLRHAYEIITHFSRSEKDSIDEINTNEAIVVLQTCVQNVLGKDIVKLSKNFTDFQELIKSRVVASDPLVEVLVKSPYFFQKLLVKVLLTSVKKHDSAQLESALANINLFLPLIWSKLRDSEKWDVGLAYSNAVTSGRKTAFAGLKSALLKVKGFDFVPETLRSEAFISAANEILGAHDGMNNFYTEVAPVRYLSNLGTIPSPAIAQCFTALLCVALGNPYGTSTTAKRIAVELLVATPDRWNYYLNTTLPGEIKILNKLTDAKPAKNWTELSEKLGWKELDLKNDKVKKLVSAKDVTKVQKKAASLATSYYLVKN